MAVKIGSARGDERGKATGGKAGDQNGGREVSTQNWYKHSKGWVVLRPVDCEAAEKIAECMEKACANNNIGYDQWQRNSLYNAVKEFDFDCSKVTKKVETDCSALIRVCCAYAGIMLNDFNTSTLVNHLMSSGKFKKFTDSKYTNSSDFLKRGDILCTKIKGHVVAVLSNGSKVTSANVVEIGNPTLKKGDKGESVKKAQELLNVWEPERLKVDGDFGNETLKAVKAFQTAFGLEADGIIGPKTWAVLEGLQAVKTVVVTGNSVNIRKGAGTKFEIVDTVKKGDEFEYVSTASNGWFKIKYKNIESYISNKYSKIK